MAPIKAGADGSIRIGATTTVAELAANPMLQALYPVLTQAAASVASPQLRNQGTVAGNLCQKTRCWYYRSEQHHCLRKEGELCFAFAGENQNHCIFGGERCVMVHASDLAPALVAIDAMVRIASPGRQRLLPVAELSVGPNVDPTRETVLAGDEVITEVVLPAPGPSLRSSYRKVRGRAAWDFALVGVALALGMTGETISTAGVVASGVAPVPWRSRTTEAALTGKPFDAATIDAACTAVTDGAEPLTHNAYKLPMLQGLLREQLEALQKG